MSNIPSSDYLEVIRALLSQQGPVYTIKYWDDEMLAKLKGLCVVDDNRTKFIPLVEVTKAGLDPNNATFDQVEMAIRIKMEQEIGNRLLDKALNDDSDQPFHTAIGYLSYVTLDDLKKACVVEQTGQNDATRTTFVSHAVVRHVGLDPATAIIADVRLAIKQMLSRR